MIIINKSNSTKYSTLAHRDIMPGTQSAEMDMAGFAAALKTVLNGCGGIFCIRLNDNERTMINKLLSLDSTGRSTRIVYRPKTPSPLEMLMKKEAAISARKIASIKAERAREEAINNEANYTSKKDIDEARRKASTIRGDVTAKKLDSNNNTPSLADLMGNNKFIEESMKHSHISTAVASEEGWDMAKMNAPKVDAATTSEVVDPVVETPTTDKSEQSAKTSKKTSRRKKENV